MPFRAQTKKTPLLLSVFNLPVLFLHGAPPFHISLVSPARASAALDVLWPVLDQELLVLLD